MLHQLLGPCPNALYNFSQSILHLPIRQLILPFSAITCHRGRPLES
jgi:hypothetical protein